MNSAADAVAARPEPQGLRGTEARGTDRPAARAHRCPSPGIVNLADESAVIVNLVDESSDIVPRVDDPADGYRRRVPTRGAGHPTADPPATQALRNAAINYCPVKFSALIALLRPCDDRVLTAVTRAA